MMIDQYKAQAEAWFRTLRDNICTAFEAIEVEQHSNSNSTEQQADTFTRTRWDRPEGGGGDMSLMRGAIFEKVGVNISTVHGEFSEKFRKEIPGAEEDPRFWASGISLVAHMRNPHVPAIHMNTRFIVVGDGGIDAKGHASDDVSGRWWFGGGADLNPMFEDEALANAFHATYQACCDRHDPEYYARFSAWCDEYFFIKHRNEARGAGGIFYDYVNTGTWAQDMAFTRDVGETFLAHYPTVVRERLSHPWTQEDRAHQLYKRGRYAEFNLVYDRGTRFGLMTNGNPEAILMSLPPVATW
ncbi:MAG: oxygen-dependent coproporphyrinogen oxidase [Sphaerospermopsis sp. SIO1G2]|nr:oxygen-dependent coproporphyrinogen oxidase [Sphaerospermopsis sp. SIO1G2]